MRREYRGPSGGRDRHLRPGPATRARRTAGGGADRGRVRRDEGRPGERLELVRGWPRPARPAPRRATRRRPTARPRRGPTRTRAPAGSPASSPQTATGIPAASAPATTPAIARSTAGCEGVLEAAEGGVAPVGGHEVLGQVVRPDAEEGDPAGELGGQEGGRRDLHHDPRHHRARRRGGRRRRPRPAPRRGARRAGPRPRASRPSGP